MRRAIVIAAHYPPESRYPNDPHWAADAELVAARFSQHGYHCVRVPPALGLLGVREELRVAPHDQPTFLYFAGYLLLTNTGEPALLLGGEATQTLALKALVHRASAQLERALIVLDVRAGSEVESAVDFSDQVLLDRAIAVATADNVDLVVRLQSWSSRSEVDSVALYDVIGALAREPGVATTRDLARALQNGAAGALVQHRQADEPFVVLPERLYAPTELALRAAPTISIGQTAKLGGDAETAPAEPSAAVQTVSDLRRSAPPKPRAFDPNFEPAALLFPDAAPETRSLPPPKPKAASATAPETPAEPTPSDGQTPIAPAPIRPVGTASLRASAPPKPPRSPDDAPAAGEARAASLGRPPKKPSLSESSAAAGSEPLREDSPSEPLLLIVSNSARVGPPPPSEPENEPPPPSWPIPLEAHPTAPPPRAIPKTEGDLEAAVDAHEGEDNKEQRISLYESFLQQHPTSKLALQRLTEELSRSEQWERLIEVYEGLLSLQTSKEAVVPLCLALARLVDHRLSDRRRALAAMERATELEPKNPELQLEAAALYERAEESEAARAHYLAALEASPLDPEVHHRLWAFFAFSGDRDRAFQAAAILDGLDAATDEEKDLYQRLASDQPPRPARPLQPSDWMLGLEPGARDPALTTLLELVSDVALRAHRLDREELTRLRARTELEDIASSTTTLARSLAWAADFLGLARPALYLEEGAAAPRPLPIHEPAWVVGKELGRGVPVLELIFHWTCALARTAGTARVLRLYSGQRLGDLLAACFVATKRPTDHKGEAVMDLALFLRQELDREALHSLAALLDGQDYEGWSTRVNAFLGEVTRCSNRAGLLACANPRLAARALTAQKLDPGALEEQIVDLFCFAMSDPYAALRKRLGLSF